MTVEELMRKWLAAFLANLDDEVDEKTRQLMMESCGKACARYHGSDRIARAIGKKSKDIDELLFELNQQKDFWCGEWRRKGDIVYSVCKECGCPLVLAGLVELSSTFCECSRGWVRTVFEAALGKPVVVKLEQAIGQGNPSCKFVVFLEE